MFLSSIANTLKSSEGKSSGGKLSGNNWWLAIVLDKTAMISGDGKTQVFRAQQSIIILSVLSLLFFLSVLPFRSVLGNNHSLWAISSSFALLAVAGIVLLWVLSNYLKTLK